MKNRQNNEFRSLQMFQNGRCCIYCIGIRLSSSPAQSPTTGYCTGIPPTNHSRCNMCAAFACFKKSNRLFSFRVVRFVCLYNRHHNSTSQVMHASPYHLTIYSNYSHTLTLSTDRYTLSCTPSHASQKAKI
jgi:hypothetical protein